MSYKNYSSQVINHSIRLSLKVSCAEYCMLLHVYDYCDAKKSKYLLYNRVLAHHIQKNLGFTQDEQIKLLRALIDKGFYHRIKIKNRFVRDKKSIFPFEPSKDNFEELWKVSGRVGNKQKALNAYKVTVRHFKHDFLLDRMKAYLEHLDIVKQAQLHLSTWLNNDTKQFLNEYKSKKSKSNDERNFFK